MELDRECMCGHSRAFHCREDGEAGVGVACCVIDCPCERWVAARCADCGCQLMRGHCVCWSDECVRYRWEIENQSLEEDGDEEIPY
jgi:hypothetical protein